VGLIPAAIFFLIGFVCTLIAGIFLLNKKKAEDGEELAPQGDPIQN
jgi:hypothetical protein